MILDLHLAIAHHLLAFLLFGVIVAELALIRPDATAQDLRRAGIIDLHYGLFAGLIVIVGFARATMAAKGWTYYSQNVFFWAKMAALLLVAILSVVPTVKMIGWRGRLKLDGTLPSGAEIKRIRAYIWMELGVFALIPGFAAAMARGYGMMG